MSDNRPVSMFYPDDLLRCANPMEQRFLLRGWLLGVVDDAEARAVPKGLIKEALADVLKAMDDEG